MNTDFPIFTKTFHISVYPKIDPTNESLSAKGKNVLITGGSRGIGKAIGKSFAVAGARTIIIMGRTASSLEIAAVEIAHAAEEVGHKVQVRAFVSNVCNTDAVSASFKAIRYDIGPLDIVVNNAADIFLGTIKDSCSDTYWKCFEANVKGTLNCMQAFARFGRDSNTTFPATFVNISTIGITMAAMPGWSAYAASKLGAWKMMEHFSAEMGDGVRVFSIHPGRIATEMTTKAGIPTFDDPGLPGAFCVWLAATLEADFLQRRLVACNWDVDELLQMKDEIVNKKLLLMELTGLTD